jgi:hypothetical protein
MDLASFFRTSGCWTFPRTPFFQTVLFYTLLPRFLPSAFTLSTHHHKMSTHLHPILPRFAFYVTKFNDSSLPRFVTSTSSIPSRPNNSRLDFLSFNVTPHIHLTIALSVLTSLRTSSTLYPMSHYHTPSLSAHAL